MSTNDPSEPRPTSCIRLDGTTEGDAFPADPSVSPVSTPSNPLVNAAPEKACLRVPASPAPSHPARERAYGSADTRTVVDSDNDKFNPDFEDEAEWGLRQGRNRGFVANVIDLYHTLQDGNVATTTATDPASSRGLFRRMRHPQLPTDNTSHPHQRLRNLESYDSDASEALDPDDPIVTGQRSINNIDDPEDIETTRSELRSKKSRKEQEQAKATFDLSAILYRQKFMMQFATALMTFGAPTHRIQSQLASASRILDLDAEYIHIPGVTICSFSDPLTKTTCLRFIKASGRLALGYLHDVHQIYRRVVHDEVSVRRATSELQTLLEARPLYGPGTRIVIAAVLSTFMCPLAFGGSFLDMWWAGLGAAFVTSVQIAMAKTSNFYANVYEVFVAIVVSLVARSLGCIRSQIFCYSAISAASIVRILPGYLILSGSLEVASKNTMSACVKIVYTLIYTLFLGFGLQLGSEIYLLFDPGAESSIVSLAAFIVPKVSLFGSYTSDDGELKGTYTYAPSKPTVSENISNGCFRPPGTAWYLQPFPFWTQFFMVPTVSVLIALAHEQPLFTLDTLVMVIISCAGYSVNKSVSLIVKGHPDITSALAAMGIGFLGNSYSRLCRGTAFTVMVPGVLLLVPSGLSQAGGIFAQGNGLEIGEAMIKVSVGITVGLLVSQAIVYMVGSRKTSAIFSF